MVPEPLAEELERANRETESQEANVIVPAEIAKQKAIVDAEARAESVKAKTEAEKEKDKAEAKPAKAKPESKSGD